MGWICQEWLANVYHEGINGNLSMCTDENVKKIDGRFCENQQFTI